MVRSAIAIGGSIEARTSPLATDCPIRGQAPFGRDDASAGDALDEAAAIGIGNDAADEECGLRQGLGFAHTVRTSRMRCVGFGTNTLPSGSRRGESPMSVAGSRIFLDMAFVSARRPVIAATASASASTRTGSTARGAPLQADAQCQARQQHQTHQHQMILRAVPRVEATLRIPRHRTDGALADPAAGSDSFPISRSSPSGALMSNTNSNRPPRSNSFEMTV